MCFNITWFVKTSTRIMKYKSRVIISNPVWSLNLYSIFALLNSLFGAAKLTKNANPDKCLFYTRHSI